MFGDEPIGSVTEDTAAAEESSEQESSDESSAATEETAEKPDASEKAKEDADTPGEKETAEEEDDILSKILEEPEDKEEPKSSVQRRIDALVGEKKALEARLAALEADRSSKDSKGPEYTDAQLRTALKKALEEQDSDLVWEIMDYRMKTQKDSMIKMYQDEQKKFTDNARRIQTEWDEVTSAYDKYADPKIPQVYPGSHKDLNLRDASSLLYQVAMELYWDSGKVRERYTGPGGQKMAVADALTKVLGFKGGKAKDSEKEKLKRQLLKEKRKKGIVGDGSPGAEDKPSRRPQTDSERLAEVIAERRQFQEERGL